MGPPDIPLPKLNDLRMPTLVVVGDRDDVEIATRARTMAQEFSVAEEITIEGAGHMVNLEKPQEFNRALEQFVRRAIN